jgi:murein L,D-transpeptidase YafK
MVRMKVRAPLWPRRSVVLGLGALALGSGRALGAAPVERADHVLVIKATRTLYLVKQGQPLAQFTVELGKNPVGPKIERGDGRTPEGFYVIDRRNPESNFHRALHINYPNTEDMMRAEEIGVDPGGNVAIHGYPASYGPFDPIGDHKDWTDGCIAVGNRAIERIWDSVVDGTPVEIRA